MDGAGAPRRVRRERALEVSGPRIDFRGKKKTKSGKATDALPAGMKVIVNKRTGLPFLKGK